MALFEAWEVFIGMIVYAAFVSLVIYFCIKYQKLEINEDDELDLETEQEKQVKNSCKMFFVVLKMKKQNGTDGVCRDYKCKVKFFFQ